MKTPCLPVSEKEILKIGFFIPMFELVTPPPPHPWGRVNLTWGASLMNKLGRGSQGDAIYQISKL